MGQQKMQDSHSREENKKDKIHNYFINIFSGSSFWATSQEGGTQLDRACALAKTNEQRKSNEES